MILKSKLPWLIGLGVPLLLVGFGLGVLASHLNLLGSSCTTFNFHYINPELGCASKPVVDKRAYIELKHTLEDFIKQKVKEQEVVSVSIYFRDLNNGPTLGIDEHEKFSPASLLKLPLLLAYLNLEEERPDVRATQIAFEFSGDILEQNIPPKEPLVQDTPYFIDDLLTHMIKYSDNQAYYALWNYLGQLSPEIDLLQETFIDLGIIDPQNFLDETITVKSYASIFAQLYHSSFFQNKLLSERALAMLADVDFKQGINAGIPASIAVAHKFGERAGFDGGLKQLHDCGIVYYPQNPYLLCVMTRGDDFQNLERVISAVSEIVYTEFDSRRL